jgi:hypothetical protein
MLFETKSQLNTKQNGRRNKQSSEYIWDPYPSCRKNAKNINHNQYKLYKIKTGFNP